MVLLPAQMAGKAHRRYHGNDERFLAGCLLASVCLSRRLSTGACPVWWEDRAYADVGNTSVSRFFGASTS